MFSFGDRDGIGYAAKLQHPMGVHYCPYSEVLYIADTFNHKIKRLAKPSNKEEGEIVKPKLKSWLGDVIHGAPRVKDGKRRQAKFNEPNDICSDF